MSRLPSPDAIVRFGPLVLAALSVPVVALTVSAFEEKFTDEEIHAQTDEAIRRASRVREMIETLEIAEREKASQSALAASAASAGAGTDDAAEDDEDGLDQLTFDLLRARCQELANIKAGAPELEKGMLWAGRLLLKELAVAARKTKGQKDLEYADGTKLQLLLTGPEALRELGRQAKFPVPSQILKDLWASQREGERVRRRQRRQDVIKAWKMLLLARETWPWVLASSATSAMSSSVATLTLYYRAKILETFQLAPSVRGERFRRAGLALLIVELVASLAACLEAQLTLRSQSLMTRGVQVRLFEAIVAKDMTWWETQKEAYKLINQVCQLPQHIKTVLQTPRVLINRVISVLMQAALVRSQSSRMLYVMVALHWAQLVARRCFDYLQLRLQSAATRNLVMPAQDQFTWIHALNPEFISMYQSFVRGPHEADDLGKFLQAQNRSLTRATAVAVGFTPVRAMLNQASLLAEYSTMGRLVSQGVVDITQGETLMHYASQVGNEIEGVYQEASGAQDNCSPLAKAYDYIAIPAKIDLEEGFDPGERSKGHIVFEDVHFAYPSRKTGVLAGVSFEATPGEIVGLTGSSGCGKSTCLRLLERFYNIKSGRILLDGKDIREYKPRWLRSQTTVVSQEPKLLPLSLRDNLIFGCTTIPKMEEIQKACQAANIWDAIMDPKKFPKGLETQMSAVQNVAGGEKQRICIARAILANPPILLLDEATSALDEVSQEHVQEALNVLMRGRTTLVIAHRLSTIKSADKIIGMKDGKVLDNGTHEELLQKTGSIYRELWEKQNAKSSPEPPPLQRAISTQGKWDVLRHQVSSLGGDAEHVAQVLATIAQLEAEGQTAKSGNRIAQRLGHSVEIVLPEDDDALGVDPLRQAGDPLNPKGPRSALLQGAELRRNAMLGTPRSQPKLTRLGTWT